jgi:hypothetical protein
MFRGYGPKDQAEQVLEAAWSFERGKVSRILDLLLKQS